MTITGQSSLAKDDIDRMVKDAEAHAAEDSRRKEEAEARNQGDTLVYQTDKLLADQGDKITGDEKSSVESALADLKSALAGDNVEQIKIGTERLMTASQTFTQKLYDQNSSEERAYAQAGNEADAPDDSEVVDAEVVDDQGEG